MPLGDLFKSQAQKDLEAKRAADEAAKANKDNAELEVFKTKRHLENQIKQLERKKQELSKRYSMLSESSKEAAGVLIEFKATGKALEKHRISLSSIATVEDRLRGGAIGSESLDDIVAEAFSAIDVLTTPETTGKMTEDEKLRVEMSLAKKLGATPSSSGLDLAQRLAGQITSDADEEISDEDALAEIKGILGAGQAKADTEADKKIKSQMKELDAKIKNLEADPIE